LFAKKKRNAINIISSIAVLAFTVCTTALIIILSTMNGFEELIFSMYNKFNPDIKITPIEGKFFEYQSTLAKIKKIEGVAFVLPSLEDHAVVRNHDYQTICTVKGVDDRYFKINDLEGRITEGEALLNEKKVPLMVLGSGVGVKVNASTSGPFSQLTVITPRRGDFSVSDPEAVKQLLIQPSGLITLDEAISNKYVFVPMSFAEQLFETNGKASSLEVKLNANANEEKVYQTIQTLLKKDFKVQNRMEQQATLYKMFKSEKWASFAILTFILLIAAFNALGSLTMLVIEKKEDIYTLISMGASKRIIQKIFFSIGFLISFFGAFLGLLIGLGLVALQQSTGFIKMQGAIVDSYPVKIKGEDILLVLFTVLLLGLIVGILPARKSVSIVKK
jgi:ABC-type lipoprotein release transport system permease subunit